MLAGTLRYTLKLSQCFLFGRLNCLFLTFLFDFFSESHFTEYIILPCLDFFTSMTCFCVFLWNPVINFFSIHVQVFYQSLFLHISNTEELCFVRKLESLFCSSFFFCIYFGKSMKTLEFLLLQFLSLHCGLVEWLIFSEISGMCSGWDQGAPGSAEVWSPVWHPSWAW